MEVLLWIVTIVGAVIFGSVGVAKLTRTRNELKALGMSYVEDFSPTAVKLIGIAEVLGAIGMILPAVTGVAQILVPLAAFGLAILMVAALVVHIRRNEYSSLRINLALLAVALFVGIARLGVAPFWG